MFAIENVIKDDLSFFISGYRKAQGVGAALARHTRAAAGMAQIAEVTQRSLIWNALFRACPAAPTEAGAQRQTAWKRPSDGEASLFREKIRTGHSILMLVPMLVDCVEFFRAMNDNTTKPTPDRLNMLLEFLQQNPGDAFARYGLAMEYSRLGQNDTALEQFAKLVELHPDYTNGYFMAAQTLERTGRTAEARKMLESGIEAARRTGNKHALSEMSGMLESL